MLNKLLHTQGEVRVQKIKINHGKTVYLQRQKFCTEHGWIDIFLFPNFDAAHSKCAPQLPKEAGAYLELPKTFKKAA